MDLFVLRPSFEIPLLDERQEAMRKLRDACQKVNHPDCFMVHGEYGELHLPVAEHRLWSPHLFFYLFPRDDHCVILGRYAPRMEVWTFIWIVYLAMSFLAFFGFVLGYSQWMVGETMWGLWAALAAVFIVVALNITAHVGQQLSADQMHVLRDRLELILEQANILVAGNTQQALPPVAAQHEHASPHA